jgi:membrane protein
VFTGIRGALSRFSEADGFFLSAGLAFFFLVTLIPIILLTVSTVGFVLSTSRAEEMIIGQLAANFPVYRREVMSALRRIVETRGLSGLLGTVTLLFFATPLFSAARHVLDMVTGVKADVHFIRRVFADMALVVLLCVLLFLATVVAWFYHWFLVVVLQPAGMPGEWMGTAGTLLSIALSASLFYLAYRYVPHRPLSPGAAVAGAAMATVLWEIAKQLFRLYIRRIGLYDQIYGTLGVLVAVVMFTYYSAIVFVFAGAYAAALDARRPR